MPADEQKDGIRRELALAAALIAAGLALSGLSLAGIAADGRRDIAQGSAPSPASVQAPSQKAPSVADR